MWSLGCCLGEDFLGCQLFSVVSYYDHLRTIIHLLGQPSDEMLQRSVYADKYFLQTNIQWRFKSPIEYQATNWKKPEVSESQFSNLEEAIKLMMADGMDKDAVLDLEVFLDFL
ncbi:hypothetical protein NQD34_010884 [Periophthalmus magnuspinnatus]|nr:hypothetical protein NQD34_010884 [Periophthalmus magnuspinnatus]